MPALRTAAAAGKIAAAEAAAETALQRALAAEDRAEKAEWRCTTLRQQLGEAAEEVSAVRIRGAEAAEAAAAAAAAELSAARATCAPPLQLPFLSPPHTPNCSGVLLYL